MNKLSSTDRTALVKLASSLPKGDETRRAVLAGIVKAAENPAWKKLEQLLAKVVKDRSTKEILKDYMDDFEHDPVEFAADLKAGHKFEAVDAFIGQAFESFGHNDGAELIEELEKEPDFRKRFEKLNDDAVKDLTQNWLKLLARPLSSPAKPYPEVLAEEVRKRFPEYAGNLVLAERKTPWGKVSLYGNFKFTSTQSYWSVWLSLDAMQSDKQVPDSDLVQVRYERAMDYYKRYGREFALLEPKPERRLDRFPRQIQEKPNVPPPSWPTLTGDLQVDADLVERYLKNLASKLH